MNVVAQFARACLSNEYTLQEYHQFKKRRTEILKAIDASEVMRRTMESDRSDLWVLFRTVVYDQGLRFDPESFEALKSSKNVLVQIESQMSLYMRMFSSSTRKHIKAREKIHGYATSTWNGSACALAMYYMAYIEWISSSTRPDETFEWLDKAMILDYEQADRTLNAILRDEHANYSYDRPQPYRDDHGLLWQPIVIKDKYTLKMSLDLRRSRRQVAQLQQQVSELRMVIGVTHTWCGPEIRQIILDYL